MKVNLEIDVSANLSAEGVDVSVYIGEDSNEPIEITVGIDEMLNDFIGFHTVGNKIQEQHAEDIQDVIDMLYDAAAKLEHRLTEDLGQQ